MSNIEEALRGAFDAELSSPAEDLVGDYRRGAERRRTRRTAAIAAGAVASVALVVGIGGAALVGGDQDSPDPAPPAPDLRTTPPAGGVLAVESTDDELFATLRGESGCTCTELWHFENAEGWRMLHEFPEESVALLAMAPDSRFGLATAGTGAVWATEDGGRSWERSAITGTGDSTQVDWLAASGDPRWPGFGFDTATGTLLRFNGESFEEVAFEQTGGALDVAEVGGALVVEAATAGFVSHDGGATWTALPLPCPGHLLAAETAVFTVCLEGAEHATVHRSTDLASWQELSGSQGLLTDRLALGDDAVLLRGEHEVLVTSAGSRPVRTGIAFDVQITDAATLGERIYLATGRGFVVSTDGGATWDRP